MKPISHDVPAPSDRVRLAVKQNHAANVELQVTLRHMEEDHLRISQGHAAERNKLMENLSVPPNPSMMDTTTPTGTKVRQMAVERLLPTRAELPARTSQLKTMPYLSDAEHEKSYIGKCEVVNQTVMPLIPGRQRRKTSETLQTEVRHQMERRRSFSLNEAYFSEHNRPTLGKESHFNMSSGLTCTSRGNSEQGNDRIIQIIRKMEVARPQSAVARRVAMPRDAKLRRLSLDVNVLAQAAKRNSVLVPLCLLHEQKSDDAGFSTHQKCANRAEPEGTKRTHLPPLPLGSLSRVSVISSVSAISSCDGESDSGSEETRLQPYSIGRITVRDSKGSFEQKTGIGGARAWAGLSTKPINRSMWNVKKQ